MKKRVVFAFPALLVCAAAAAQTPHCLDLAAFVRTDPRILNATSVITPAAGANPAYCQVNLTQHHAINIRVGLPLSAADDGAGGVQGAWNGKLQHLGGGGFAGSVGAVTGPVSARYVSSSTDTGHSNAWCNAINPETGLRNAQQNCGVAGAGFVLDPNNQLIEFQVRDFITDSLHAQVDWSLKLANHYYGVPPVRNYWNGCSTGGRQGMEMAQKYGELFDGLLVGAPVMNWSRGPTANLWPPTVVNQLLGSAGLPPARSNAANAAAVAACDANDGVVDGIVNEPRRCTFDARSLLCETSGSDPATCLSAAEAEALNRIWSGPSNPEGHRLWGGLTVGTSFGTLLPGGNQAAGLATGNHQYWVMQDPSWDWRTLDFENFAAQFAARDAKFREYAATDDPNLDKLRNRGGKMIHYHGSADQLVLAFNSFNYASRVLQRYGVDDAQSFMRSFFYPGIGHCGGGSAPAMNATDLFTALTDWVENGVAPDHIVARQNLAGGVVRTRKVCKYPDEAVYLGAGSTDDEASFACARNAAEPADLAAHSFVGPIMKCKDVTATAGATCTAQALVDDGSSGRYGEAIALAQSPGNLFGLGATSVALTGTDVREASASCQATVRVVDATVPSITQVTATPGVLWPPNHKLRPVSVAVSAGDNCDAGVASRCKIVSVASNEPITHADWKLDGPLALSLRAERDDEGTGRNYVIGVECADASGNSIRSAVTVKVPHNQGSDG